MPLLDLFSNSSGGTVDSEYAGGEVERCCGVGALQASRDELDAAGRIGNGSARGRSEAKRNTNRKKQRKKTHHPVNGRNFFNKNIDSRTHYPFMQVYGDSADVWHIIREMHVGVGVEYELIPKTTYARIPPPGGGQPAEAPPPHPGAAAVSRESTEGSGGRGGTGMGSGASQGTGGGGGIGAGQGGGNRSAVVQ